ncbi:MAG TPA: flagellar biosynthesis anti-sigma factor FlgM [Noviherbaspirillum sp.]|nr:flagellar biosynthesis anti-sigma factor FlgM [Noviherbaspirillum sp.]
MKIPDSFNKATGLGATQAQARSGKTTEKAGTEKASSDNVTLSAQAQALASQASKDQVFDAKKVEEIKAAIASGQFQVNAERVADGLLSTVKDLLSARNG